MIEVKDGAVRLSGPAFVIETELALIIRSMFEEKLLTKDKVDMMVKMATMSEEELKEMAEMKQKDVNEIISSLNNILNILNKDSGEKDTFSNMFKDLDI